MELPPQPKIPIVRLSLIQQGALFDVRLLISAREHVGAAGIEQMAALERLIAAGQEHTGLARAASQVRQVLLQQPPALQALQGLLLESEQQLVWMNQLEQTVTAALQQITATPVQRISAEVLEDIAERMQRQLTALEQLVVSVKESLAVSDAATPTLEAIQATLHAELARVAQEERRGHLATLVHLAGQACQEIASVEGMTPLDRVASLQQVVALAHQQIDHLSQAPPDEHV